MKKPKLGKRAADALWMQFGFRAHGSNQRAIAFYRPSAVAAIIEEQTGAINLLNALKAIVAEAGSNAYFTTETMHAAREAIAKAEAKP